MSRTVLLIAVILVAAAIVAVFILSTANLQVG